MVNYLLVFSSLLFLCNLTASKAFLQNNKIPNGSCSTTSPSTLSSNQWAISKIELDKAWDISTGSSDVKVGIIDSGIRGTHEDLLSNINSSLSIVSSTTSYTTPFSDLHGHGTHIAGIIGANGDNTSGIAGVCWNVSLVSLRGGWVEEDEDHNLKTYISNTEIAEFTDYAENHNIKILNLSYGGGAYNSDLLSDLSNYSGLLVCSAGNNGSDSLYYPACYNLDNIISVGNSTSDDLKASSSNYGYSVVDIFAPGTNILSTMKGSDSDYAYWSGTSMAAPYVAGFAALLKSINPTLTTAQLKSAILDNADHVTSLSSYCLYGRRLNAYKSAMAVLPSFEAGQSISSLTPIPSGGHQWFKVVAQPGTYYFNNSDSVNLTATLFSDIQGTALISGTSNGPGEFFNYTFTTGGTYFIKILNNSSFPSSYSILSSPNHIHSYYYDYEWKNHTQHYAYCSCGSHITQGHVIHSGEEYCILCDGPVSSGFIIPSSVNQPILNDSYVLPSGIISLGNQDYSLFIIGLLSIEDIFDWNTL